MSITIHLSLLLLLIWVAISALILSTGSFFIEGPLGYFSLVWLCLGIIGWVIYGIFLLLKITILS